MSRPEKEGGYIIKHVLLTAKTICVTKILAWQGELYGSSWLYLKSSM